MFELFTRLNISDILKVSFKNRSYLVLYCPKIFEKIDRDFLPQIDRFLYGSFSPNWPIFQTSVDFYLTNFSNYFSHLPNHLLS